MADDITPTPTVPAAITPDPSQSDYVEFEIGKHRVPWFLWLFFAIIISWASISWIKFFGY